MSATIVKLTGTGTWVVPEGVTSLSSLLVIGGGGGGGGTPVEPWPAGGGGAGQVRSFTDVAVTPGESISYSVGAGGAGGAVGAQNQGADGSSTTFDTVTATGGGGGGSDTVGRAGGSGGGGSGNRAGGAAADTDFGKAGGPGSSSGPAYYGGGGGGFSQAGGVREVGVWVSGYNPSGGNGYDASLIFSAHGESGWFAAGGAGGQYESGAYDPGTGGQGGGGDATDGSTTYNGGAGLADTGSGGAGAGGDTSGGGAGGDGATGVILIAFSGGALEVDAYVSVPGPLAAPATFAISDWTQNLPPLAQIYYACELQLSGDSERLPISSWQATIQNDRASYLQAVVPGASGYIARITELADGDLVIFRGVRLDDGINLEMEMARVPLGEVNYQQGPTNATATLSGYGQVSFQSVDPEDPSSSRTLTGLRSISIQRGYRVRSDIDWLLRPGMIAVANGNSFTTSYINFYVTGGGEAYMDVGERTL